MPTSCLCICVDMQCHECVFCVNWLKITNWFFKILTKDKLTEGRYLTELSNFQIVMPFKWYFFNLILFRCVHHSSNLKWKRASDNMNNLLFNPFLWHPSIVINVYMSLYVLLSNIGYLKISTNCTCKIVSSQEQQNLLGKYSSRIRMVGIQPVENDILGNWYKNI